MAVSRNRTRNEMRLRAGRKAAQNIELICQSPFVARNPLLRFKEKSPIISK